MLLNSDSEPNGLTQQCDTPVIELRNVVKTYQKTKHSQAVSALNNVSLSVQAGDFVAITGTSGSGKSTLLNMVAGIDTPDSGEIILSGSPIHQLSDDEKTNYRAEHIGFVFQFFNLLDSLTVIENIMLPLQAGPQSYLSAKEQKERACEMLGQVQLSARADFYPSQLSGGQMQRVAIARALIHQPDIILSDEPTGNLDSQTGEAVLNVLIEQCHAYGCTLLMVTHDDACVERASKVYQMNDGVLV